MTEDDELVHEAEALGEAPPPPDPEVAARRRRRRSPAAYRLRILEEADACSEQGELGRLLRREGL